MSQQSKRQLSFLLCLSGALLLGHLGRVDAQTFPNRPVRISTGLPVGSAPDVMLRVLAEKLSQEWKQPVIVDNRPGASGIIAMEAAKKAAPDGYELHLADTTDLTINRHAYKKLPYDPAQDFVPIGMYFRATFFMIVPTASPYKSVGELIADAKSRPNAINFGSFGVSNVTRLHMEIFAASAGISMTNVPFRDTGTLITSVASLDVHVMMNSAASAAAGLQSGKLRLLAVGAPARLASHPAVPTVDEAGGPRLEATTWVGLIAPRGTPPAVVAKVNADLNRILASSKDLQERFQVVGLQLAGGSPEEFAEAIRRDDQRFGSVIKRLNIQLD